MRAITVRMRLRVDNGEPIPAELRVETEMIDVTCLSATRPDPRWSMVDAAGHYHAWSDRELPTLETHPEHVSCSLPEDHEDCDGYTVTHWHCRICGEEITPGVVPDTEPRKAPGRTWWTVRAVALQPWVNERLGELVSVRCTGECSEWFGVGSLRLTGVRNDGMNVEILGAGPLGQRKVTS